MSASAAMEGQTQGRPQTPHKSHSFTRFESPRSSPLSRSRASTLQNGTIPEAMQVDVASSPLGENQRPDGDDIFEKDNLVSSLQGGTQDVNDLDSLNEIPAGFDELPIELISMVDRFVESLSARVHNTPPSIEKLSSIFQDFYMKTEAHIGTHISALSTRQSRGSSPNPSISSRGSNNTKDSNRLRSSSSKDTISSTNAGLEHQMLTPQEISDRRKARRLLDRKKVALEEAIERRICERVYNRIWRHRSTLDEVRDEKLRSRTAALALVGIGLKDLGITFDASSPLVQDSEIEDWISKARDGLLRMNEAKFPLGKLQQLAEAHKIIVDLLTGLHQSSSSADEILPTLIYTLITSPPEGINVISNLHFIQRFRAANKIDGEAAYCLINLEAAITFLETVDLASLRSDEMLQGPQKMNSRPGTPHSDTHSDPLRKTQPVGTDTESLHKPLSVSSQPLFEGLSDSPGISTPTEPKSPTHQRKLSNLFQPPSSAIGAASDAVRTSADQSIKTIGNTLDNSFKLLFGRLKEHKVTGDGPDVDGTITVPRTLEDARKLVEPKPDEDEDAPATPLATVSEENSATNIKSDDSLLSAIAGRKQPPRDRSVDSVHSAGSGGKKIKDSSNASSRPPPPPSANSGNGAVESMLNLGNTLNPLKGFSGFGVRGFGRAATSSPPPAGSSTNSAAAAAASSAVSSATIVEDSSNKERKLPPSNKSPTPTPTPPRTPHKIQQPNQRFIDVDNAADLKIGEVNELLGDYKRLARALRDLRAF
ncbi:hypothetical protein ACLMJK_004452 [Lecanora helva]